MRNILRAFSLVCMVACSSNSDETGSSSGSGACPDISGNYSVTSTRVSGSCDAAIDSAGATSVTFAKGDDGAWNIVLPGIEGGCPGTLSSTCKFVATCKATDKSGTTIATYNIDYTFSGTGLHGSSAAAIMPPLVAKGCNVTYSDKGSKL